MNKLIEKIVERLEEKKGTYFDGLTCEGTKIQINDVIDIIHEEAKDYNESLLNDLVEAKRCCSEDSDCSQCIFGQIEDRCVLAELQIDKTVKTNADYIRSLSDEELAKCNVQYFDDIGKYYTSDGESFDEREEAIGHEIDWLKEESEG